MTLTQVNTAIETILTSGQSYTIDGMSYSAANLGTLRELRTEMMAQTSRPTRPLFRAFRATSMGYGAPSTQDADLVKTVTP